MTNLAFDTDKNYYMTETQSNSSEEQFNFDIEDEKSFSQQDEPHNIFQQEEPPKVISDSTSGLFPEIPDVQVEARKRINRVISSKISKTIKDQLFKERLRLIEKKFNSDDGLTKKEHKQLALIDWKLDRIEDAECGEELDRLTSFVATQEQYSRDIDRFINNLKATGRNIIKR